MANIENLKPIQSKKEARELGQKGGIASGIARKEKATMKKTLEMLLDETNKKSGKSYKELVTLGLIKGAINGKADNYKTIMEAIGELNGSEIKVTPEININVVNNEDLEKVMYEKEL